MHEEYRNPSRTFADWLIVHPQRRGTARFGGSLRGGMASSVLMDGGHAAPAGALHALRVLRRPSLLAGALALVIAGGAIGALSSGPRPARAVARPVPSFVGRIPALSPTAASPALFAGAVPALALVAHPRHRSHRAAPRPAATSPSRSATIPPVSVAPAPRSSTLAAPAGSAATVTSTAATRSTSTAVHHTVSTTRTPAFGASGALGPGSSPSS
jgi:hypothetical protein